MGSPAAWLREHGWVGLMHAPEEHKANKELVLAAVALYGQALEYASTELKADKEVVLAAVAQDGWALRYASAGLKADKEVVLAAVAKIGGALMFASEELKADKEVRLTASLAGGALKYASEEMQANKQLVLAAVAQKKNGRTKRWCSLPWQQGLYLMKMSAFKWITHPFTGVLALIESVSLRPRLCPRHIEFVPPKPARSPLVQLVLLNRRHSQLTDHDRRRGQEFVWWQEFSHSWIHE